MRRTQDFHLLWLLLSLQFPSPPRLAVAVVTYNSQSSTKEGGPRFSCWTPIQGVFTRCYSHHHGYFLFLHLIICLNSVGDRDGEMGWSLFEWILNEMNRMNLSILSILLSSDDFPSTLFSFLPSLPLSPSYSPSFHFWPCWLKQYVLAFKYYNWCLTINILFIPFHILLRSSS